VITERERQAPLESAAPALHHALGAVLAGGGSTRFGSPKALARMGGVPLVAAVARAMAAAVSRPVVITHLPDVAAAAGVPARRDRVAGAGPLGGIETALLWARELALPGALCVACDLPLVTPELLRLIVRCGLESGAEAAVPDGVGPGRLEPLCAWYSVSALEPVRHALRRSDLSLHGLIETLRVAPVERARVSACGDPEVLFLNVNTPAAHARALRIAGGPP
jgi:molybdopterin-guanine dinucleotide biosynthesis protein A